MHTSSPRFWPLGLFLLILVLGAYTWFGKEDRPISMPLPPISGTTTLIASPSRIVIPKIEVDAAVQHVGVTQGGNMAVPTNYEDAGWYRLGAAPGETGNAVIAGHLDTGSGRAAVFSDLDLLRPGDEIYVMNEEGETARFVVERLEIFEYDDNAEEVFGASNEVRLNLITCDGIWNPSRKMYDKRLVVFAQAAGGGEG